MPGVEAPSAVIDVRALRRALERGCGGGPDARAALAALSRRRAQLAAPLSSAGARGPDPALRRQLVARQEVSVAVGGEGGGGGGGQPPLRLTADTVSVAVALSDELHVHEVDAALLLADARVRMHRRPDRDVVAAAKDIYFARRRELVLFLQELLRVHLLGSDNGGVGGAHEDDVNASGGGVGGGEIPEDSAFREALLRERDGLIVENDLLYNIVARLTAGLGSLQAPTTANPRPAPSNPLDALHNDEALLLAECVFLITYSVQVTSRDALAVRDLFEKVVDLVAGVVREDESRYLAAQRASSHTWSSGAHFVPPDSLSSDKTPITLRSGVIRTKENAVPSYARVRAESVQNVLYLAWLCCLDRSRYSDLYNPATGESGVNALLKDPVFVKRSCGLPPFGTPQANVTSSQPERAANGHQQSNEHGVQILNGDQLPEGTDDLVLSLRPARAAAELGGALFRLAVAEPDTEEALLTVLRVCAYGSALEYLSEELPDWMEFGAGSLMPDSQLYADVFEDFSFDLSEAPDLPNLLFRWTQDELHAFASSNLSARDSSYLGMGAHYGHVFSHGAPALEKTGQNSRKMPPSSGKPPRPPTTREALSISPRLETGTFSRVYPTGEGQDNVVRSADRPKNLVASFGRLTARAVDLNPEKLLCDSGSGGSRYWVGIGPDVIGLVPRVGDAVLDMWDAALGSGVNRVSPPDASRGYRGQQFDATAVTTENCFEEAFVEALQAFLDLLRATSVMNGSVTHAAAALRFLCESGHPVASIERASQALNHFQEMLSAPRSTASLEIGESETRALSGVLSIISNCARSLEPHGGISPIIGHVGTELGSRAALLALEEVPSMLRASLVELITWLGDRRAVAMFLDGAVKNKAAKLRQMIRGQEAQAGLYDTTIRIMELTKECCAWAGDDFPRYGVEGVLAFAVDEVLAHWSQRKYATDYERWRVISVTGETLLAIVRREHEEEEGNALSNGIFSKLLCPAPGTGSACSALRALVLSAGLGRTTDDRLSVGQSLSRNSFDGVVGSLANVYQIAGRDSLAHACRSGDGEGLREMELAGAVASRVLSHTLSLPPSHVTYDTAVPARASELILGEPKALLAAGSLVFTMDDICSLPSPFRLGYSVQTCRAVLGMLALASSQSSHICKILTPGDEPIASSKFRCSLAGVISDHGTLSGLIDPQDNTVNGDDVFSDPPLMVSALHLVEACLGMDGSSMPGLYLLGLSKCIGDHVFESDYGVLSALVELVGGIVHGLPQRIDDLSRSTAAVFLERLAGNTRPSTSRSVIDFIRRVSVSHKGEARGDTAEEGCGIFGDEMLSRILEVSADEVVALTALPEATVKESSSINWSPVGQLAGACMKLVALQVRHFPDSEQDLLLLANANPQRRLRIPSPYSLLRLVAAIAEGGSIIAAVDAFHKWHHLLASRLRVHPACQGYAVVSLLMDIVMALLDALDSSNTGTDLTSVVLEDGGSSAAAAILLCLGHIRELEAPMSSSGQGVLLSKVIRALSRMQGGGPNMGQARTSLYAAFLICGQMVESQASSEKIAQGFGGRVGERHTSGAEALVTCASLDACSALPSATRAAAITSLAFAARLDPLRVIPALSAQNRLRRVVLNAIADPSVVSRIVEGCSRGAPESGDFSSEKATVVVAEAALSLIHSISLVRDGARLISEAGCLDSLAVLLSSLSSAPYAVASSGYTDDWSGTESVEDQFILVADSVTCAVAAAAVSSDSGLVEGALAALHAGERIYCRAIRSLGRPRKVYLSTASHVAMVLSRIPHHILSSGAVPAHLRSLLACYVGSLVPHYQSDADLGESNSAFSAGLRLLRPGDARDAARMKVLHPEGGSLFERDMVAARVECLKFVLTALRPPVGLLLFFAPRLATRAHRAAPSKNSGAIDELTGSQGELSDVLRIAHAALGEVRRSGEESLRLDGAFADETSSSISSRDLAEIAEFCAEEAGISLEQVTGTVGITCMREAARAAREQADTCVTVLESAMYILREYTAAAGARSSSASGKLKLSDTNEFLSVHEADDLIEQAQTVLLPLCKEVDSMPAGVWGRVDPSFCRQLCRQIRTNVATGLRPGSHNL